MKEVKTVGRMVPSGRTTWDGEAIFAQEVIVTDTKGNVLRRGERYVMADGKPPPPRSLSYDNQGIL